MDRNKIKVWYDEESGILYVSFKEGVSVDSEEIDENIRAEYREKGELVGIEIHNLSKLVAKSLESQIQELAKL